MNKMREPLFRASTKHANWDQKEEKVEKKNWRHAMQGIQLISVTWID